MVHYDPPSKNAAQAPPPVCPKCGSHRTEVIGLSEDLTLKYVRCNACGYRSAVPNDSQKAGAVSTSGGR